MFSYDNGEVDACLSLSIGSIRSSETQSVSEPTLIRLRKPLWQLGEDDRKRQEAKRTPWRQGQPKTELPLPTQMECSQEWWFC